MSQTDEVAALPPDRTPGMQVGGKAKHRGDAAKAEHRDKRARKADALEAAAKPVRDGDVRIDAPSPAKGRDGKRAGTKPPGAKSVGWALVQAARLHRGRIGDRLAALELFAGQEQVVQVLAAAGTMTMGDLAQTLRVRPPTASKTISRLAALGFVERRAEAGDGRVVRVRLTEAGLAKAEAIERIWDDVEAELLDALDGKERRRLRKLLRKAARGLADAAGLTGQETEVDAEIEAEEDEAVPPA